MKLRLCVHEAWYDRPEGDEYAGASLVLRVHEEPSGGFTASQVLREPGESDFTVRVWFASRTAADRYVADQGAFIREEGWRMDCAFTCTPSMS